MFKINKSTATFLLVVFGVLTWCIESFVHLMVFSEDSYLESLFYNVSAHELYMRILLITSLCFLFLLLIKNNTIKNKEAQIKNILNNVIPICITNLKYEIINANDSYWSIWGMDENRPLKCYDHRPGASCHTKSCSMAKILSGMNESSYESKKRYKGADHYFIVTTRPFVDHKSKLKGIIESFQDITELKKLESEKETLIKELQSSLDKVKLLSGFLPICASCKKIRNDKGYWSQIETYISSHSEAQFSHGICPECAKKLYPDIDLS